MLFNWNVFFQVIAERLSEEEIGGLKELFKMIDTDNSGTITFEELKVGLKKVGSQLMEHEIKSLMEAVNNLLTIWHEIVLSIKSNNFLCWDSRIILTLVLL